MSIANIGKRARRLGATISEFGDAFEAGQTQDLRISIADDGGVHLTGTEPKPTGGAGTAPGGLPTPLLIGLGLAVVLFAARS